MTLLKQKILTLEELTPHKTTVSIEQGEGRFLPLF